MPTGHGPALADPPAGLAPGPPSGPLGRHPRRRRRRPGLLSLVPIVVATGLLAWAAAVLVSAGVAGGGRGTAAATSRHAPAEPRAVRDAASFLGRYEAGDGRVVRWDQGGDTVSEGQAYAMLAAVATGDRGRFAAAWGWAESHLQRNDGLLAWRWSDGRVQDDEPAADADVDAAWALSLASTRFGVAGYRADSARIGRAVLASEVVPAAGGTVVVAGPWAAGETPLLDPSYDAPVDFAALAGADRAWDVVASGFRGQMASLLAGGHLPSDWAVVDAGGRAHPTTAPGPGGGPVTYGYDAARVPVRLAASCDPGDRRMAASLWPALQRDVDHGEPLIDLDLGGSPVAGAPDGPDPVGLVGAAGAADAAGQPATARSLLDRARRAADRQPTYYGSAWVALGGLLLETQRLGGCASMTASTSSP